MNRRRVLLISGWAAAIVVLAIGQRALESQQPMVDAERILRHFTRRAFRRTVTDEDIKPFLARVQARGAALVRSQIVDLPNFLARLKSFNDVPPATASRSPILTDDRARVEGLLR